MERQPHLPRRLRRLRDIRLGTPIFFVTFCCAGRRPLLAEKTVHDLFAGYCRRSPDALGAHVGRYVLMPDHAHVFVGCEASEVLSKWVSGLKGMLAAHWRRAGTTGPFWQEGFFDHLLRSDESYEAKWEYVRNNPVRRGLAPTPDQWAFAGEIGSLSWGL